MRAYFAHQDLFAHWRHHTGHAIGIRYHEGPFLDSGDTTEIRPGMVFTVEPGLYAPDVGGFRHSDTVLVTDDGIEILTYYPRDLESLVVPRSEEAKGDRGRPRWHPGRPGQRGDVILALLGSPTRTNVSSRMRGALGIDARVLWPQEAGSLLTCRGQSADLRGSMCCRTWTVVSPGSS